MPPNGGFGGNTGIHDAHNLAWKLALALKGLAGPELLATYEQERRPAGKFTVEQAYTRYVTRSATYLGAKDYEPPVNDFNIELGYLYHSPAIVAEDDDEAEITISAPLLKRYKDNLNAFVGGIKQWCTQRGITYIFTSNQYPFDKLILNYLRKRGLVK